MGLWPCFPFSSVLHGKADCPSCSLGLPAQTPPLPQCRHRSPSLCRRELGEWTLVQRKWKETESSCFLFSKKVFSGLLHTSSPRVQVACSRGLRRKGTWVQPPGLGPRQVHCGRESHFPLSTTGQPHATIPLSTQVSAYVVPATEGTQTLPERTLVAPLKVHHPASHAFLYKQTLKPVSVLFLCVDQFPSL